MSNAADKSGRSGGATATRDAAPDDLVLPDESDRIISDLRAQLRSLQDELSTYKRDEPPGEFPVHPAPAGATGRDGPPPTSGVAGSLGAWSEEPGAEVAARLHAPAHDLTQRLERLIAQVEDPVLREELKTCLETAFYLFATFRHISDNQRTLLGSLEEAHGVVALAELAAQVQAALSEHAISVTPDTPGAWPDGQGGAPESVAAVTGTVARIAQDLVGPVHRVTLAVEGAQGGQGARDGVCITIACTGAGEALKSIESAAQLVFTPAVSALTVVDWLYMEKIVELQGGSLRLYHEGDRAAGFQVRVPLKMPT